MMFNSTNQLKWAWSLTKGHRAALLTYFFLELFAIILSLLFVFWSKQAIDIAMKSSTDDLKVILILVVASVLLALVIRGFSGWLNERTRLKMGLTLQRKMIEVQMLSVWKVIKSWHSGDVQVRIHSDCNEVVSMMAYSGVSFLLTLIRLLASFGFLWSMDPMLAFMLLPITPLFLFSKLYYRKMRRLSRDLKQEESNFGKVLQENLKFKMLIRGMDLLSERKRKTDASQDHIYNLKSEQLNFSTFTQGAMKLTINMSYLFTFIWGVYRLHTGQISFGTMTAFLQLVGRIQTPILGLFGFVPLFIRFRTAVERVYELLGGESEPPVHVQKVAGLQALTIENLSFKYEDLSVIEELSMEVKRGIPTAILGSSGKGKTTLLRLLLAILQPQRGELYLVDDHQRFAITPAHRINFAYVPQGNSLFTGTIRENIMMAHSSEDEARLNKVLWLSCAEFVHQLPEGLDTFIGESGHGLSEGQAQRIAIARALMRDSDIWIFDEVTSALDSEVAEELATRLMQEGKDKLCIFVTHDSELAKKCSQRIYLN